MYDGEYDHESIIRNDDDNEEEDALCVVSVVNNESPV